jgi:hypothetical protein
VVNTNQYYIHLSPFFINLAVPGFTEVRSVISEIKKRRELSTVHPWYTVHALTSLSHLPVRWRHNTPIKSVLLSLGLFWAPVMAVLSHTDRRTNATVSAQRHRWNSFVSCIPRMNVLQAWDMVMVRCTSLRFQCVWVWNLASHPKGRTWINDGGRHI